MNLDKGQLIFYDDENMEVYNVENVQVNNDMHYCEEPRRADMMPIVSLSCVAHTIDFDTRFEKVELDPTTMRRIAKFNKEVEIKNLDKTIEDKKDELEEVRQEILKQEKKLESIKEFVGKFIKSNSETIEEYIEHDDDNEYDYDEDDE